MLAQNSISDQTNAAVGTATNISPCEYRTGRVLGTGSYGVVKEAIHVSHDDFFSLFYSIPLKPNGI